MDVLCVFYLGLSRRLGRDLCALSKRYIVSEYSRTTSETIALSISSTYYLYFLSRLNVGLLVTYGRKGIRRKTILTLGNYLRRLKFIRRIMGGLDLLNVRLDRDLRTTLDLGPIRCGARSVGTMNEEDVRRQTIIGVDLVIRRYKDSIRDITSRVLASSCCYGAYKARVLLYTYVGRTMLKGVSELKGGTKKRVYSCQGALYIKGLIRTNTMSNIIVTGIRRIYLKIRLFKIGFKGVTRNLVLKKYGDNALTMAKDLLVYLIDPLAYRSRVYLVILIRRIGKGRYGLT